MAQSQYTLDLATGYAKAKEHMSPLQRLAHEAFLRAVGCTDKLNIGDFGCGTGDSTRLIAGLGKPALLMGFDCSEPMLVLAQQAEGEHSLGILYEQTDCAIDLPGLTKRNFHLVTAMWLLHYAENKRMLAGFANTAFGALRPGGRLVTVVQDKFALNDESKKYGERRKWEEGDEPLVEGSRQRVFLLDPSGNSFCDFLIRYWTRKTYTKALRTAGFTNIAWSKLHFDETTRATMPDWQVIEEVASCSLLTACRP